MARGSHGPFGHTSYPDVCLKRQDRYENFREDISSSKFNTKTLYIPLITSLPTNYYYYYYYYYYTGFPGGGGSTNITSTCTTSGSSSSSSSSSSRVVVVVVVVATTPWIIVTPEQLTVSLSQTTNF